MSENRSAGVCILGGGIAGLGVAYYLTRRGYSVEVLEGDSAVGGLARTFASGEFRFDAGAHRLHEKDAQTTAEIEMLLRDDLLRRIDAPSQIWCEGKTVDFPLSPYNVLRNLGVIETLRSAGALLVERLQKDGPEDSFEVVALRRYGRPLARAFLLNYSEKLWGLPAHELSPEVAGQRMRGLTVETFLLEMLRGRTARTRHLDGEFLYPAEGIGVLADRLAASAGVVQCGRRVEAIDWSGDRVLCVHTADGRRHVADWFVATLPLPSLVGMLSPKPPVEVERAAAALEYRALVLCAIPIARDRITPNASIYFPGADVPFSRLCEPKNRGPAMAPAGRTMLVAEWPCREEDDVWNRSDEAISTEVIHHLVRLGLVSESECEDGMVHRLSHAYPVLRRNSFEAVREIRSWMSGLKNFDLIGRNATFRYVHIHDLLRDARELAGRFEPAVPSE